MNYPSTHKTLLERVQSGDDVSWEEFYDRYAPIIRYVGTLYRFKEGECDDLVQNVMTKFFVNAKRFEYREGKVKFRTYLATIVRSQATDMIRKRSVQQNAESQVESGKMSAPFEESFLTEWRKIMLEEAKAEVKKRVDAKTYQAFLFYGLQNRPVKQVAETLELTANQIYLAKNRCAQMMKEIIARYNDADGELNLDV